MVCAVGLAVALPRNNLETVISMNDETATTVHCMFLRVEVLPFVFDEFENCHVIEGNI